MARHFTLPTLFPPPGYAHGAVVAPGEELLFTAGAVPLDAEGRLVGPGDITAQTRQVLANLDAVLRDAHTTLAHVVSSTVYVVVPGPDSQPLLAEAWRAVQSTPLAAGPHTSTLLGVSCLGYPGQLVEVTAVATLPRGSEG
jgi:enamine deaminase RidA (YjgF/YER057c/UK114 family)